MVPKIEKLAQHLRRGGVVIYPTETLYALGCLATLSSAVEQIFVLKGRSRSKTLPLLVANWDMAARFFILDDASLRLARHFWPGALSLLVRAAPEISPLAKDNRGYSAVRMTPHPLAAALSNAAGAPLISTSANRSGQPPVANPNDLDPLFVCDVPILADEPWPGGGAPSTLVEVLSTASLRILREGAISSEALRALGYRVRK